MRTVFILSFVSALVGCSSLDGVYVGDCTVKQSGEDTEYSVEVEITQSSSGGIDGDGEVVNSLDQLSEGDIDGERDDDDIRFTIEFNDGLLDGGAMLFQGVISGDEIDGRCELDSYKEGSFDLTRKD